MLLVAGASARATACSALAAGLRVHTADLFADADLAERCQTLRIDRYPQGLAAIAAQTAADAWLYTGGLENHPALVDAVSLHVPLWGNPGGVLRQVRDPRQVVAALGRWRIRAPAVLSRAPRGNETAQPWLLKSSRSCGGSRVRRWFAGGAFPHGADAYWQQFAPGPSGSAAYVAAGGDCQLLGCTRQILISRRRNAADEPFCYAGSIGPVWPSIANRLTLERIGRCLARSFSLVGLFGVDYIASPAGPMPVEVNPRYTASMEVLERASGASYIARHAAACQGRAMPPPPRYPCGAVSGKLVVYAQRRGRVEVDLLKEAPRDSRDRRRWADLPPVGTEFATGDPLLTVLADGDSAGAVQAELAAAARRARELLSP